MSKVEEEDKARAIAAVADHEDFRPTILRCSSWEDPPLKLWVLRYPLGGATYDRVYKTEAGAHRGMKSKRYQDWWDRQDRGE